MARDVALGPRQQSYWLDQIDPMPALPQVPPARVDVLVIGAGYTGLNAAIQTARGGRSTLVIDAHAPGYGCSTRNGGQISTSVKPSRAKLAAKFGDARALAIRDEGCAAPSVKGFKATITMKKDANPPFRSPHQSGRVKQTNLQKTAPKRTS